MELGREASQHGLQTQPAGTFVLLLSAFCTVASREEMRLVVDRLAAEGFGCILMDWPGLGMPLS